MSSHIVATIKKREPMTVAFLVEDGIIVDAKFKTFGCGAAIATSSMVTELVRGRAWRRH